MFDVCAVSSAAGRRGWTLPGTEQRQNLESIPLPRRRRIARPKRENISDDIVNDIKPRRMLRPAKLRVPGRLRGHRMYEHILRLPQAADSSSVCSTSSFDIAVTNSEDIHAGRSHLPATVSSEELNHWYVMNGDHDYHRSSNGELIAERLAANGTVFSAYRCRDLSAYESLTGRCDEKAADLSRDFVNGANMSCGGNVFLSAVEADHSYAVRPATPVDSFKSEPVVDNGSDSLLARLTILNAMSTHCPISSCHTDHTMSLPRIQKCTVTLNKLNDADLERQQSTIKLQLRSLDRRGPDRSSADEEMDDHCDEGSSASHASSRSSSACDDMSLTSADQTVDVSDPSCFVPPSNLTAAGQTCNDWMLTGHSGLELLASVSSLTADRLQHASQPANTSSTSELCWTESTDSSHQSCRFISHPANRRIKVFRIRNKCSVDEETGSCPVELQDIVQDVVVKGVTEPVCQVRRVSCGEQCHETACNSVMMVHGCHSALQNGPIKLS